MEFKVNEYQLPGEPTFNYNELKQELTEKVEIYKNLVYTEEQVKDAKADRTNLNKLKAALNDERIRREKEYMQPFNEFKAKVVEIIKIIDEPINMIDTQVKGYEEKKKQEKLEKVKEVWEEVKADAPELLEFEKVFDEKMLNASYSMAHVKQKMLDDIKKVNRDLATLSDLPEFGFEAVEVYKTTLDMNEALNEARKMSQIAKLKAEAKAKAEREAMLKAEAEAEAKKEQEFAKAMNPPVEETVSKIEQVEPKKSWVKFSAHLTVEQAKELKQFFDDRGIEFMAI